MGSGDSIPLKVKTQACVNSLSHCTTNDAPYSSDACPTKSTTPIELDNEIIKMIIKRPKRHKRRKKPLFQYKPLFSWDSHSISNAGCSKERKDKVKRKTVFEVQDSFRSKAVMNYLPATSETPQSESNSTLQQTDNIKSNSLSCKTSISRVGLQPLITQIAFAENYRPQTKCELLLLSDRSPLKQSGVGGAKSSSNNIKQLRRASVCEKDLIHTRAREMPLLNPKRLANISIQRRSSLLKEETLISSIARLKCVTEDNKDLPKIKRMNAFVDNKEEVKKSSIIAEDEEGAKNTESIAVMVREQHRKKSQKNNIKPEGQFTSKAEKKRLWVGVNGKFDAARLKSWYSKMNNIL
jgi:hypothetical protein